jgi:glutamate decarboxylase
MVPTAEKLMFTCFDENMIDKGEYSRAAALRSGACECSPGLWHAPDPATAIDCSTTGSSAGFPSLGRDAGHPGQASCGERS